MARCAPGLGQALERPEQARRGWGCWDSTRRAGNDSRGTRPPERNRERVARLGSWLVVRRGKDVAGVVVACGAAGMRLPRSGKQRGRGIPGRWPAKGRKRLRTGGPPRRTQAGNALVSTWPGSSVFRCPARHHDGFGHGRGSGRCLDCGLGEAIEDVVDRLLEALVRGVEPLGRPSGALVGRGIEQHEVQRCR